jgi:hypothetical protein
MPQLGNITLIYRVDYAIRQPETNSETRSVPPSPKRRKKFNRLKQAQTYDPLITPSSLALTSLTKPCYCALGIAQRCLQDMERLTIRHKFLAARVGSTGAIARPGCLRPLVTEEIQRIRGLLICGALNPVKAGRTLFSYGYELDKQGLSEQADSIYQDNIELLESLCEDHSSPVRLSHVASLAYDHGRALFSLGRYDNAAASFSRSIEVYDSILCLDASQTLIELLSNSLAWLGRSQRKAAQFTAAERNYRRAISLKRHCLKLPSSPEHETLLQNRLGAALIGYSKVLKKLGRSRSAVAMRREAERILL